MKPEQRDRSIQVMQMVQSDVQADVRRRDGLPFNGITVAEALGEIAAQIGALAHGIELLLREHEGAQR